jgi:alkylation response protein AidB-like acyl-CoA dehydrogenase
MRQPGVQVRPLREMTGRALFNEVFIDEARVRAADIIGGLNNGWAVANTTLMVERASIGAGGAAGLGVALPGSVTGHRRRRAGEFTKERASTAAGAFGAATAKRFAALARADGADRDPVVRQGLAELHTLTALNQWNGLRARHGQSRTGVEGSLAKLLLTHTLRRARDVGADDAAADGMVMGPDTRSGGAVQELTVFSPGPAIYGGTDQVQRNIVAERGLGLPKEPGDQRDVPFRDLPKN